MAPLTIRAAHPSEPEAAALIARHLGQMSGQSPPESQHALDGSGLAAPGVAFFLGQRDGQTIAMGAIKDLGDGTAELKSMHTLSEARGTGAGRAMLAHLLAVALREGHHTVYLETGATEDFAAARALYAAQGFTETAPFADYKPDPWSVFMRLELAQDA